MKTENRNEDSDFLKGMPNHLPFKTPEYYFDEFPTKMQQRIAELNSERQSFWKRLLTVSEWPSAVTLVAFFFATLVSALLFRPSESDNLSGISATTDSVQQSASTYLVENFDFDEDLLISEYTQTATRLNNKEIENYIIDNFNDTQILEEL